MREVVIFRHNLFRVSEPFITAQAQALKRYKPCYLGRLRFGAPPPGAECLTLHTPGRWRSMFDVGWQMLSRRPEPYQRLLRGHHPALIHAHFGVEGTYALPLAEHLGVPLVTTFHGFDATLATPFLFCSPAWAEYPLFRRALARKGSLFLCVSSFIRERVLALGFPEERTRLHYIGIDCDSIRPRDPAEERPLILHVARLVTVKGTRYLLEAFKVLLARHPEIRLVIVGDGPLRRSLEARSASLGLAESVQFLGAQPHANVLSWMRKAAVFVLPGVRTATGRVEGLGMALLEAAATGVPSVASRLGGIPEAVTDGETGFLVPERDPAAIAHAISVLLEDRAKRLRMGANARAFVAQRFDIRRQTATLERLYDAVLSHDR